MCIPVADLEAVLKKQKIKATLSLEDGSPQEWIQLVIAHRDRTEIAVIDRSTVAPASLAAEEIEEFKHEIARC